MDREPSVLILSSCLSVVRWCPAFPFLHHVTCSHAFPTMGPATAWYHLVANDCKSVGWKSNFLSPWDKSAGDIRRVLPLWLLLLAMIYPAWGLPTVARPGGPMSPLLGSRGLGYVPFSSWPESVVSFYRHYPRKSFTIHPWHSTPRGRILRPVRLPVVNLRSQKQCTVRSGSQEKNLSDHHL